MASDGALPPSPPARAGADAAAAAAASGDEGDASAPATPRARGQGDAVDGNDDILSRVRVAVAAPSHDDGEGGEGGEAAVFRPPCRRGTGAAAGVASRAGRPVGESDEAAGHGGGGPPETPRGGATVSDAHLSTEVARHCREHRHGIGGGHAVLNEGRVDGHDDLLSRVRAAVAAPSHDDGGASGPESGERAEDERGGDDEDDT